MSALFPAIQGGGGRQLSLLSTLLCKESITMGSLDIAGTTQVSYLLKLIGQSTDACMKRDSRAFFTRPTSGMPH